MKTVEFLKGKKTYIVGAVTFILGGLQALGYPIPAEVYALLAGLGLAALRAGVSNS